MSTSASSFFRCRVCGHTQYSPVRVRQATGAWEATSYWKCMSCSVMFTDPKAFALPAESAAIATELSKTTAAETA